MPAVAAPIVAARRPTLPLLAADGDRLASRAGRRRRGRGVPALRPGHPEDYPRVALPRAPLVGAGALATAVASADLRPVRLVRWPLDQAVGGERVAPVGCAAPPAVPRRPVVLPRRVQQCGERAPAVYVRPAAPCRPWLLCALRAAPGDMAASGRDGRLPGAEGYSARGAGSRLPGDLSADHGVVCPGACRAGTGGVSDGPWKAARTRRPGRGPVGHLYRDGLGHRAVAVVDRL